VQCSNEITVAIINIFRKFRGRAGSSSNTKSPGLRPISMTSTILINRAVWPQQTWTENLGVPPPFVEVERGPHLTQSRLGRSPCRVASWCMQPFGHNRYGPKIRGGYALWGREIELGPHLTQCGQGRDLPAACLLSFILIGPTVWPQYINVTDRQNSTAQHRQTTDG